MHTDVVEGRYGRVDVLAATDELIRLDKQLGFHRRGISNPTARNAPSAMWPNH
jgi:hypothetical protein